MWCVLLVEHYNNRMSSDSLCVKLLCLWFFCMLSEEPENVEKFQKRLVKVTPQHNDECKRLLQLMGIPYIEVCTDISIVDVVHDISINKTKTSFICARPQCK